MKVLKDNSEWAFDDLEKPKTIKGKIYKFLLPEFFKSDLKGSISIITAVSYTLVNLFTNFCIVFTLYNLIF